MEYILGPRERKEVYEQMLEEFKADTKYVKMSGFCFFLNRYYGVKGEVENYPELLAQKPSTELVFSCYWWNVHQESNGREKRIEALKKAIKLVNKLL